jgi:parallel beta-helix repeat protein
MRFGFHVGDLQAWDGIDQARVIVMNRWSESHLPVAFVDEGRQIVSFSKRTVFRLEPGDLYYLQNALAFLDRPGEWFLDQEAGKLYYMPLPGEQMQTAQVIAPYLSQLARMQADPDQGQHVEGVIWRGLTFSHTEWYFGPDFRPTWPSADIGGFAQAAVGVPGAIYGEGVRDCAFEDCNFLHIGNYCLELAGGCQENRIEGCSFLDVGAGAIKIGQQQIVDDRSGRTFGNRIANCMIVDCGKVFHSAVGIWIGQAYNSIIGYNEICDLYYTGISIGWTWGYGRSLASANIVEFNHVHHIGKKTDGDGPILSDMGGIYTLGIQPGTVIRNNLWHDIAGLRYGGWGIYLDEGSSDILVENNLVYNTTHGGFHQHYGRNNIIRNNIFFNGRDHQIQATRSEDHLRFTFICNIVVGRTEQWLAGSVDKNMRFSNNIYWREGGGAIRFGNLSWQQWQGLGMDTDSIIADPLFLDPANNDLRLHPDSPALKLGFKPFDPSQAGHNRPSL